MKPALTPAKQTTTSKILNDCEIAQDNSKKMAQWVADNPWIDNAKLYMALPGCAMILFEPHSKAALVEKLGVSGWSARGDEVAKIIDGIQIVLRRERPTYNGEVSEEEMKGI